MEQTDKSSQFSCILHDLISIVAPQVSSQDLETW